MSIDIRYVGREENPEYAKCKSRLEVNLSGGTSNPYLYSLGILDLIFSNSPIFTHPIPRLIPFHYRVPIN